MKKSYVYKITCLVTGEYYFGSSFRAKSDRYWGGGKRIRERIAHYGKENFVKEIIEEFDDRVEAHKKENQYIEKFRNDDKCLNKRLDHHFELYGEESRAKIGAANAIANRGRILSEEHRAKLSAAKRGKKGPWYGKHFSAEHRAKLSAAMRGKHCTEEAKALISAAMCGENNPMYGKNFSEEHRAKMSAAHRGKTFSEEVKAKMSVAHRGKHWRKNPVTGKREWYD